MEIPNKEHIDELIAEGSKIQAIKELRDATGMSLRDCKEYIENGKVDVITPVRKSKVIIDRNREPAPPIQPQYSDISELIVRCPACGSQSTEPHKGFLGITTRKCTVCNKKF